MRVWRLALRQLREMDGEGARLQGGRWNSPGTPVVYAATHISLALAEQRVHLSPEQMPDAFRTLAIEVPDDATVETAAPSVHPSDPAACRQYGDGWAGSRRRAILIVPSVVVAAGLQPGDIATEARNLLLNPRHAAADAWRVVKASFRVDPRLMGTK